VSPCSDSYESQIITGGATHVFEAGLDGVDDAFDGRRVLSALLALKDDAGMADD